ncbi:MAG: putative transposase [Crocinitomix sp.]|jgi:putative transposase
MEIRDLNIDHFDKLNTALATIQLWVFKFTTILDKEFRKRKKPVGRS